MTVSAIEPARPRGALATATAAAVGPALLLAVFMAGTAAVTLHTGRHVGYATAAALVALYVLMLVIFLGIVTLAAFVRMAAVDRPERPLPHFAGVIGRFLSDGRRMAEAALLSVLLTGFMGCFAVMKESIPTLNPFRWDVAFAQMDRALFLGFDAWRVTFSIFGSPLATTVLNAVYHAWLFMIYMFLLAAVFGFLRPRLQRRFLYAFFLTWVVGGVLLAIVFSSAGPVYFARLGLGEQFEPLMHALRAFNQTSPVWALGVQEDLWASYAGTGGSIAGISAMPSMHVGSSVIVMLVAFAIHRYFGIAMAAFAATILIGSVHLGWHYAVDGIAGGLIAWACWAAAERLAGADLAWQARVTRT